MTPDKACLIKGIPLICVCTALLLYVFYNSLRVDLNLQPTHISKDWPSIRTPTNVTTAAYSPMTVPWNMPSKTQLGEALSNATEMFHIIIWDPPFGAKSTYSLDTTNCGTCDVSYNKTSVNNPETKAIVFHFKELNLMSMPQPRRSDQYYTWWSLEGTPALRQMHGMTLREYDGVFNLTMSYRQDADVYIPYGKAEDISRHLQATGSGNPIKDIDELVEKKKQLVLSIVSNCGLTEGARKRLQIVEELISAGVQVDRRGGCFPQGKPAPRDKQHEIISEFKFYLSFENSIHCRDYITEQLFVNSFTHGAVPIVFGAKKSDYQAVVPPHPCTYVDDFKTASDLVKYILYLDKNVTAYREYFLWRNMKPEEMPNYSRVTGLCALCRILHGFNVDNVYNPFYVERYSSISLLGFSNQSRIVSSLREWFCGLDSRETRLSSNVLKTNVCPFQFFHLIHLAQFELCKSKSE